MGRIFVHIASYRDPETLPTVQDLFAKAADPSRLTVVIALQQAPGDAFIFQHPQVRTIVINAAETRGACWARSVGYRLLDDEDYVLQLDSHMRFAEHWDDKCIATWGMCRERKALLTTYPPAYEPPYDYKGYEPTFLSAHRFDDRGFLEQRAMIHASSAAPKPTALMSGNFLFGPAQWVRDVPYDPHLYFHGEEITLAVRSWTSGWDMFGPHEPIVWHRYGREGRNTHWGDDPEWWRRDVHSMARMKHILGVEQTSGAAAIEIDRYGLGTARTLSEYQEWSGIDFKTQTISEHAAIGEFSWQRLG